MYSLEEELSELRAAGALDEASASRMIAIERRTVFSLYEELRVALYAAVALVVTGVGILVKEHLDRIGPITFILALALTGAACYVPAIRERARATPRSAVAEYLLLLGALLVSADLGYAESQFHWFGANWSRHLLILAALHAFTAYALESRLILSVALTSLAGWFGIERGPGSIAIWHFGTSALSVRALLCAAVILLWRAIDQRMNAARFNEIFEHFAANLAFWGALGWCSDAHDRVFGVPVLLALAWVSIRTALRSGTEQFAVYGVGYTALGLSIVAAQILQLPSLSGAVAVLVIVLAATFVLRHLHETLKEAPP
jgi:Ca2+/Na+ antiporter